MLPVLALAVIAPVCAEYLVGYDDSIGDPAALLFGLVVFVPVYGAPAVLIREIARRTQRGQGERGRDPRGPDRRGPARGGWPAILLLATAFGVVQAGLLDQSLFNPHYRDISYWDHLWQPTLLPGGWTSAAMIAGFVGGHVVGSISAPIAVTEALFPARAENGWLGPAGLVVAGIAWAAGAAVVLGDTLAHEAFRLSVAQVATCVLIVAALVTAALTVPRPFTAAPRLGRPACTQAPPPVAVFIVAGLALGIRPLLDSLEVGSRAAGGWGATLAALAVLVAFAVLLLRWSARSGWDGRHRLAVAAGALTAIAVVAFTVHPVGHVPSGAKYITNSVLFMLLVALLVLACRRQRRTRTLTSARPQMP